jgi:hypothetical protein
MSSASVLTFLPAGDCPKTNSLLQLSTLSLLTLTSCPAYKHLGMNRAENTVPVLLFPVVSMQTCLFAKPFLSNGCCIAASFAVVAEQRIYSGAGMVRRVLSVRTAANFQDPPLPCVRFSAVGGALRLDTGPHTGPSELR